MSNITTFNFNGADVRTIVLPNGEPGFVGKDVCDRLGYANHNDAIGKHCRGVAIRYPIPDALGRTQETRILTELEALRHQVKVLDAQLISEREQSYRANLRDVELHQAAQADADRLRAALTSVCRSMAGECTPKRLLTAGDVCFHEAARALWPNA